MILTRQEFVQLSHKVHYAIMSSLLDRATKKMRGGTVNFEDDVLKIIMIFDSELSHDEEMGMKHAYEDIMKELGQKFETIELSLEVVDPSVSLLDRPGGNMGWFFLRREMPRRFIIYKADKPSWMD